MTPEPHGVTDAALRRLDDYQLETLRLSMLRDSDERYEPVLRQLVIRGVPAIERICRQQGEELGLSRTQIGQAIEDACARLLLRLHRSEALPPVSAIAAQFASQCTQAQQPSPPGPPRLASERPELRLIRRDGRPISRNDWRTS